MCSIDISELAQMCQKHKKGKPNTPCDGVIHKDLQEKELSKLLFLLMDNDFVAIC